MYLLLLTALLLPALALLLPALALSCSPPGVAVNATRRAYACDGQPVSEFVYSEMGDSAVARGCTATQDERTVCVCPFDRTGDNCEIHVHSTCTLTIQPLGPHSDVNNDSSNSTLRRPPSALQQTNSPFVICEPDAFLPLRGQQWDLPLDGVPPCWTVADVGRVLVAIKCVFSHTVQEAPTASIREKLSRDGFVLDWFPPFSYWTRRVDAENRTVFARSRADVSLDWTVRDFNRPFAPTHHWPLLVSPDWANGSVPAIMELANITANMTAAGGRVYLECALSIVGDPPLTHVLFAEVEGFSPPPAPSRAVNAGAIVGIVFAAIAALSIILCVLRTCYKQRRVRERVVHLSDHRNAQGLRLPAVPRSDSPAELGDHGRANANGGRNAKASDHVLFHGLRSRIHAPH